jgi:hypothetical protein
MLLGMGFGLFSAIRRVLETLFTTVHGYSHFGACRPGEFSHSWMCAVTSICLTFSRRSYCAPVRASIGRPFVAALPCGRLTVPRTYGDVSGCLACAPPSLLKWAGAQPAFSSPMNALVRCGDDENCAPQFRGAPPLNCKRHLEPIGGHGHDDNAGRDDGGNGACLPHHPRVRGAWDRRVH